MSSDIGEQLLRDIRRDFAAELGDNDKRLAALLKKITDKKANLFDVSLFSSECGKALSRAIAKNLSPEMLRNGAVTYEITRKLLHGVMKDNYDLINMAAQAVQQRLDNDLNIHIAPQTAAFPAQRIDSIASSLTDTTASDATLKRRMDAPVRNVTDSFYTDYVETNADLRSKAGLKTTITRFTNGKCCDWCAALAGHYVYPDVPENIWAFHDNCTCSLLYSNAKTTSMHSRLNRSGYRLEGKAKERALGNAARPVRFTRQQAENIERRELERVTEGSKVKYSYQSAVVDRHMLESSEYRRHIDRLGENTQTSRAIYQSIKSTLSHRSGTQYENLTYINAVTNESITRSDYNKERECMPSKAMKSMLRASPGEIIAIHNHPGNSVPSIADINAARDGKYKYGIIACHNGNLFKYRVNNSYDENEVDFWLDNLNRALYNDNSSNSRIANALKQLKENNVEVEVISWK